MSSQKQTEANRLNARKSTGPRSVEGKAASSMNALKSGIDAQSQIIRGENAANLQALTAEYYDRFHPTTPEQRMLVDLLVDSEWLLRRFRIVEAQLWEQTARYVVDEAKDETNKDVVLGIAASSDSNSFIRLQRRIDVTQRNYRTALQDLTHLQAESPEPVPDPAPQPDPPAPSNQPVANENGFVPQPVPPIPADPSRAPLADLFSPRVVRPSRSSLP
jgi:hypothetical protein